jgi:ATP phosphoribosyltransferase regulatory subunit HisZ
VTPPPAARPQTTAAEETAAEEAAAAAAAEEKEGEGGVRVDELMTMLGVRSLLALLVHKYTY